MVEGKSVLEFIYYRYMSYPSMVVMLQFSLLGYPVGFGTIYFQREKEVGPGLPRTVW